MFILFIFIIIISFIVYHFNSDRKDEKINVLRAGGMKNTYPNFLTFIEALTNNRLNIVDWKTSNFQCVKDDGEYLEFKFPCLDNEKIVGYYFIGIQHVFVSYAYCYCKNINNRKIEGYMKEIKTTSINDRRDIETERYAVIFRGLISQMENSSDYFVKF